MSLKGHGAIAIWNDITDAGRRNFYEWHGREHIAERIGIPGFLRGRRYLGLDAEPEYFTLYETVFEDAFRSEAYAERLNSPTPWTLTSTAEFRNVARALCAVAFSRSAGDGGLMATWRYDLEDAALAAHRRTLAENAPQILMRDGVCGLHLLLTDAAASGVDNAERRRRGTPNEIPSCILMLEGWTEPAPFRAVCNAVAADLLSPTPSQFGVYQLQVMQARAA